MWCSTALVSGPWATGVPFLFLGRILEALESDRHHVREETVEVGQAVGAQAVQASRPVVPFGNQTGFAQDLQMLRDRRLGHREARCNIAGSALAICQQPEDLAALGLRYRLEDPHDTSEFSIY